MSPRRVGAASVFLIATLGAVLAACATTPAAQAPKHPAAGVVFLTAEGQLRLAAPDGSQPQRLLPALAGALRDARVTGDGERVVTISCLESERDPPCAVELHDLFGTGAQPEVLLGKGAFTTILAVDATGTTALIEDKGARSSRVSLARAGQPVRSIGNFRMIWDGSFTDGGGEIVVGAIAATCTGDARRCPIASWRIQVASDVPPAAMERNECVFYQLSFVPGSRDTYVFQGTTDVPECPEDTNKLPVAIKLQGPGGTRVLRERAVGPSLSRDGKRIAWLHSPADCTELPCSTYDVEVADVKEPSTPRVVAQGNIITPRHFSRDGRLLAVRQWQPLMKSTFGARIVVVDLESGQTKPIGFGRVAGWR